ncbi:hypothetical protein FH972_023029 [Carpinus fangiana]|uniref:Methyltransferase domain-containing protein n=1 Tax=Carpinus fangiana TaxID=176857 RepID=A0A5N6KUF8_9ROSI|nr:hypothetical protein FH972_023029 [Carpinus fangiana]
MTDCTPLTSLPPMESEKAALTAADPTFTTYTPAQAARYNSHRSTYSSALYAVILAHHNHTAGGPARLLLDVGCGPGTATRPLAAQGSFAAAIGIDASPAMIAAARAATPPPPPPPPPSLSDPSSPPNHPPQPPTPQITYTTLPAESCDAALPAPATADLLTAATAAHWLGRWVRRLS